MWAPAPMLIRSPLRIDTFGAMRTPAPSVSLRFGSTCE